MNEDNKYNKNWATSLVLDQLDQHFFHSVYLSNQTDLKELCDNYIRHVGFRKHHILRMVRDRIAQRASEKIFDPHWRLLPAFVPDRLGSYSNVYHGQVEDSGSEHIILPSSENEYFDTKFPAKLRYCFAREKRNALKLYTAADAALFCDVGMYQVYDRHEDRIWSTASPFSLTKSIQTMPGVPIDGSIVYVGDIFSGTNFSHFLFDYITRVGNLIESGVFQTVFPKGGRSTFIFSGIPGDFQKVLTVALGKVYGITPDRIVFPDAPTNYIPSGIIGWFSDAYEHNQHPAQLMHPRSVGILRTIAKHIPSGSGKHKRLYISRADALQRRISNESDLVKVLAKLGFETVVLSKIPLIEQISIVQGAEIIVAPHGMGLTHCAFHPGGLSLVELFSPETGTDAYASLARAFGFKYDYVLGTALSRTIDFSISIDEVLAKI